MVGFEQTRKAACCCTLCPAGCELRLASTGPDFWRVEVPLTDAAGLCPRGSTWGELLSHRRRILSPARRREGRLEPLELRAALESIVQAAADRGIVLFLDANLPCEQLVAADAWCRAWPAARLCLVMEPADEQMLLGAEAAGAEPLSEEALAGCDGFLIVGDAFAANPCCSRGVFERRAAEPRTPIVVIDPAGGTAAKFATHRAAAPPGGELRALAAVASGAGLELDLSALLAAGETPAAAAAGRALAPCRRLGVLLAAEYGRSTAWRQIAYLAGRLAAQRGGGLACQTAGANVIGAARCAASFQTVPLAQAAADDARAWVVLGCDLLGMLGWTDRKVLAAAAPLPNASTEAAELILPVPLLVEMGGTCLLSGGRKVESEPLLAAPAAVPTPAEIIEQMARLAGAAAPQVPGVPELLGAAPAEAPELVADGTDPSPPVLLLARQAMHAGSGALTGHGSWQAGARRMVLRISPGDAHEMHLKNLDAVRVCVGQRSAAAEVSLSRELGDGVMVLGEGLVEARALVPCRLDRARDMLVATPAAVKIEA